MVSQVTGCDSIVELTLDIYPSYRFDTTITTCSNVLTNWRSHVNVNYWQTGTYYDTVPTAHGCDSVFVLHLYVVPSFYSRQTQYICKNDTVDWHLQRIYYEPANERDVYTTYTVTYSTGEACDSTYILDVYFFDWYTQRDTDVICGNQPYYWRGRTLTQPGVYYDSLQTKVCHCDSTFILYLSHHPVYLYEQYDSICRNEEWAVGDYVLDDTLYSIYGCDSIYRTYLHVSPDYAFDTVFTFRDDEVSVWQNQRYVGYQAGGDYRVGEYYDTVRYTSKYGCDSIYRARFTVYYEHYDTARVFCTGESTMWHGRTYTAQLATTLYDTIRTYTTWGNDSTFYFRVRFTQSYYFPDSVSVCVDEGYENWHGHPIDSLLARVYRLRQQDSTAVIIVSLHWGQEHKLEPVPRQRHDAHMLVHAGADVLVCHHTHTLQSVEDYGGRKIYYSIGNFIFDQPKPLNARAAMVRLRITADSLSVETLPVEIRHCAPHIK